MYYAVKVIGKKRIDEGEKVHHFSVNQWKWRDITQDTKDAITRDEEEAKAKAETEA